MRPIFAALIATFSAGTAFAASHADEGLEHFFESWDLNSDGVISLPEATEQREGIFYMFDADENGVLDTAEYDLFDTTRAAATETGAERSKAMQAVDTLKREFNDSNQDGQISHDEFITGTDIWLKALDRNKDGQVSLVDFQQS